MRKERQRQYNPPVRVLHVNDYDSAGGAEVLLHQTINLLQQHGVEAECFFGAETPTLPTGPIAYIDSRRFRRSLSAQLDELAPDIVHLHNFYHLLSPGILATLDRWKRDSGGAVLATAHDFHLICPNAGLNHWRRGAMQRTSPTESRSIMTLLARRWDHRSRGHGFLKAAQHLWNYRLHTRREVIGTVICPSRFMQKAMKQTGLETVFLPNPVRVPHPAIERTDDHLRLIFVGRLEREKGIDRIVAHWPESPVVSLTIIGDGALREEIERAADKRELSNIDLRGALPHDETLKAIAHAHVLILPSLTYENCPLVLWEALGLHTNILVSEFGGMREVVESTGVGFTFDPHKPEALRASIGAIERALAEGTLNDFDIDRELEARSPDRYIEQLLKIYQR